MDGSQSNGDGQMVVVPQAAREVRVVNDVIPMLDTARFEHMQRIATVMAETSTIPDSLRLVKVSGNDVELPRHRVIANCFMIVNQAVRWQMDPFAIAQCASIVHGKLMWEGKLVHAVIEAKLGVRLLYTFTNETDPPTQKLGVIVSATMPGEDQPRTIEGTVADWHKGDKSPWAYPGTNGSKWKRQLRYMGAREWARAHAPGVMLGVLADDEADVEIAPQRQAPARLRPAPAADALTTDIPEETPTAPDAKAAPPAAAASPALDPESAATIAELIRRLDGCTPKAAHQIERDMSLRLDALKPEARKGADRLIEAAKKVG